MIQIYLYFPGLDLGNGLQHTGCMYMYSTRTVASTCLMPPTSQPAMPARIAGRGALSHAQQHAAGAAAGRRRRRAPWLLLGLQPDMPNHRKNFKRAAAKMVAGQAAEAARAAIVACPCQTCRSCTAQHAAARANCRSKGGAPDAPLVLADSLLGDALKHPGSPPLAEERTRILFPKWPGLRFDKYARADGVLSHRLAALDDHLRTRQTTVDWPHS